MLGFSSSCQAAALPPAELGGHIVGQVGLPVDHPPLAAGHPCRSETREVHASCQEWQRSSTSIMCQSHLSKAGHKHNSCQVLITTSPPTGVTAIVPGTHQVAVQLPANGSSTAILHHRQHPSHCQPATAPQPSSNTGSNNAAWHHQTSSITLQPGPGTHLAGARMPPRPAGGQPDQHLTRLWGWLQCWTAALPPGPACPAVHSTHQEVRTLHQPAGTFGCA